MGVCCSARQKDALKQPVVAVSSKSRAAIQRLEAQQAELERYVQAVIAKGQPWTDPDFPPNQSSLYDPNLDEVDVQTYNSFSWKRASDIFQNPQIFEDGVDPNDIN